MGAFNNLILDDGDYVQFKFGVRWQYEYHLGDRIEFDANDTSARGRHEVSGIGGDYPRETKYYALTFEDGVIAAAREISKAEFEGLHKAEQD